MKVKNAIVHVGLILCCGGDQLLPAIAVTPSLSEEIMKDYRMNIRLEIWAGYSQNVTPDQWLVQHQFWPILQSLRQMDRYGFVTIDGAKFELPQIGETDFPHWGARMANFASKSVKNAAQISPKYQVVIPKEVRKQFNLKPGQKILFIPYNGTLRVIMIQPIHKARGMLKGINRENIREEVDKDR